MIWRRLFIIFKDIQLNHWNAGIKQLTNEVVLYYERIDFNYWKKLKEEYESSANNTSISISLTNGGERNGENSKNNENNNNTNKIPVIVPNTLVPSKYHKEKKTKVQQRTKSRITKWKIIKQTAQTNKQTMFKDIGEIQMNGHSSKSNDDSKDEIDNNNSKKSMKSQKSKPAIKRNADDQKESKKQRESEIELQPETDKNEASNNDKKNTT